METPRSSWKRVLRWFFGISLFCSFVLRAGAAIYIIDEKSNPSGLIIKASPANSGTLFTSSTAATTINSYQFAYWTLNGVRQADATGRAANPVKFVPTSDSTLEAIYKLATQDSDGDGLLDVFELEFFGTLLETKVSDGEGDGFDVAMELLLGFHPGMWDGMREGGLSRRSSATLPVLLNPAFYQVFATSDPPGFVEPVVLFAKGSAQNVTLPNAPASVNGYNFSGWYVGTVRAEAPTALQPVVVSVSGETTFTAKYIFSSTDSDADALMDWFEWFAFSNLSSDSASDPDSDLISTLFEQLLGFTPYLKDAVVEGGVSRRSSAVVDVNLSGQFFLTIQSDPPGMQPSSVVWGVPNSVVETPDILNANINGYRFTGWYVDGQRLTDSTGASAGKGVVLLSNNKVATALFVLDTIDSDLDGVADWIEKFYMGGLSSDQFTDAEGDLLNFAVEALVGFHPLLVDKVNEGGISRRGWGPSPTDYVILNWRPVIDVHPAPVTVAAGAAFSLSVSVTSFAAEKYQWQKDGADIPGATTDTYSVASASGVHSGAYRVVVTNVFGTATSNLASVSVGGALVISVHPAVGLAANVGGSAGFSVSAAGTAPLTYQWRKNGVAIAGATSATYSIGSVQAGDVARYDVVVGNATGSVTSAEGSLILNSPVTISTQPISAAVGQGSEVTFSVLAGGSPPLGYQWRKGGVAIPGAVAAQYTVGGAQSYDEGSYDVVVSNPAGSVTSVGAVLSVNSPPVIAAHPSPQTVSAGSSATFGVTATGTDPLLYQWRKAGVALAGGTQATYKIASVQASDAGSYDVVVTNAIGTATSFAVPLLVNVAPSILSQPTSVAVVSGTLVSLAVNAAGTAPLTYQWRKGGTPVAGAVYPTFSLGAARVADSGVYDVVVSNAAGSVSSNPATLTVGTLPTLVEQPLAGGVRSGGSYQFSVSATGTAPLAYQWRRNSVPISGATSAIYSIASVQAAHVGDYDVVVSNAIGSVPSNVAKLTILAGASIDIQPVSQRANPGTAVTLNVVASGPGPLTYQWRRNGVAIKGATAAVYKITSLQTGSDGLYDVLVTNPGGSVASEQAVVALNKAVVITKPPVAVALNPGAAANFTVAVSGTEPFTYQWRKGTVAIPGATSPSYSIAAAQSGDAGSYNVVVQNVVGSVTSASATLTLNVPISITTQPVGGGVNRGASRTVSVAATGTAPFTYQWRRNGTAVVGGTAASFTIAAAQESNVGVYDVLVGNVVGNLVSGTASVTLNVPPAITTQPASQVVNPGKAAVFSVVAGGTAPLTYQWRRNGTNLSGATGAVYTISSAQAASAGTYDVVVRNVAGNATSLGASLAVNTPVSISRQPLTLAVNPGAEAIFRVTAAGTAPLTYQWRKNGAALAGGTGSSFVLRSAQTADAGNYDVVVGNVVGSVASSVARLSVNVPPAITVQPVGAVLNLGVSRTLNVTVTGTAPLGYQWRKNGAPIAGATGSSYALGAVQAASAGTYDVVVSNTAGSATSAVALISVNAPPLITVHPGSLVVAAGGTLALGVTATGNGALTYQWRKGGVSIAGATGPSYVVPSAHITDAGSYDVVVRNPYGSVTSAATAVTIGGPLVAPRYQFVAGNFTWLQAKADAEIKGGHLATITSAAEWIDATGQLGANSTRIMWLGRYQSLDAASPLADWKWVTGESASFSNWASGEPNGTYPQGGTEGYVLVNWLDTVAYPAGSWLNARNNEAMVQGYLLEIEAPEITSQPAPLTVATGSSAALSVAAFGGIPLSYQWRKNGVPISGGTHAAFMLPATALADAGTYDVVITNSKGTITSAGATLTVNGPPLAILIHPKDASTNAGGAAAFSVTATGTEPLLYQWRKNGVSIAQGTAASLALADIQHADAATYDVVVSDVTGSLASAPALLALNVVPTLGAQPVPVVVNTGAPATLSVAVTGTGPINYQWRRDGVPIAGGTAATLALPSVQSNDAGLYDVVISNVAGTVTSTPARLSINSPVSIVGQPTSLALNPGGSGALTVAVTGTGPFAYQWRKNGGPVPGATFASLTLSGVQASDTGSYDVVVTNVAGSVSSDAVPVTLNAPVSVTGQPQGGAFNPGAALSLGVTVAGTGPFGYQWLKNGAPIPGATGATFALPVLTSADAGRYSVLVSNVVGNLTSVDAEVSVNSPVKITAQPVALTVSAETPALFAVSADGTGPFTYQWRFNGNPVAGGTAAVLAIGAAQSSDAGSYDVLVGNAVGTVVSAPASLVVNKTASVTSEPVDVVANPGAPITFSVTAAGTGPFTYQWRRDGANIAGAASSTLTLSAVQLSDVGSYDVLVTNPAGSVVSRGATLALNTPVTIVTQPRGFTANQGASWSLGVTAVGTGPLSYQWRKGGLPVVGGTGATLEAVAAQMSDAGSYDVVVTNVVGKVTSAAVTVGVNAATTITQEPVGVTLEMCAPLTLRVTAAGTGPLSYQWRKNGEPIPDAVEAVYTNPAVGPGDGGSYDVVVTNVVGSVASGLARVVVTEVPGKVYPPTIARHPMRALVQPGASLTLRVSAAGTGPLAYQWFRNGAELSGATGPTYSVASMGASNMGLYCVRITNSGGAVLSEKAQVVVAGAPGIVKDPASFKDLDDGATVRLSATARGTLPFNYTWKKDDGTSVASGVLPANPTGVEIPLSVVAGGKTMGSYRLVVWNEFGKEESAPATVELALRSTRLLRHGWTVLLAPRDYPAGVNKLVGTFPSKAVTLDDTLIVSFGSVDTHTYEWGYSTSSAPQPKAIPGQTKPYLALVNVPGLALTSAYILQVKITAKSSGAVWVLKFATNTFKPGAGNAPPPLGIALDLNDAYVPSGGTGNFGVALTANGAQFGCTFNWYRQGLLGAPVLVGVNSTGFFSVPRVTSPDDADYFVVVVDALGRSVESKRAHLWVFPDGE